MKIAIFHCGFIYSGGGERIVLEEARGLKQRGYEVIVFAPTLDCKKCYPELVRELDVRTFFPPLIDWLPFRYGLRMLAASLFAPLLAWQFRGVDIFLGANQPGAWIAFCVARVLGKPYVVYLNQPNRLLYPRPVDRLFGWYSTVQDYQLLYKLIQLIRPIITYLDRISITGTDQLFVNGAYIGGVIEKVYSKKTVAAPAGAYSHGYHQLLLNPHTVYTGSIRVAERKIAKPYALITNRHDPQKRFDYVIRALSAVVQTYLDVRLIIPGPFTSHTQDLLKLTQQLGLSAKVYFLGQISEQELQKLYQHCAVYCYPAPEEDFGLGPLEAGGWGVPTVAWKFAGPTVTVEDGETGVLAQPYVVEDYAEKILLLLQNQQLRAKMGRAAWERTSKLFSWERHVDILEHTIVKLREGIC